MPAWVVLRALKRPSFYPPLCNTHVLRHLYECRKMLSYVLHHSSSCNSFEIFLVVAVFFSFDAVTHSFLPDFQPKPRHRVQPYMRASAVRGPFCLVPDTKDRSISGHDPNLRTPRHSLISLKGIILGTTISGVVIGDTKNLDPINPKP